MTHTHTTRINILWKVLGLALIGGALGFFLPSLFPSSHASAKECVGESGNLEGYIQTQNLGKIYVSKTSWDADHSGNPASTNFYVFYDRERNRWSGRGLNEDVGWVDFDYDQQGRKARFVAPEEEYERLHDSDPNNDEPVEWGNWRGVVDLSDVEYDVQHARFVGDVVEKDDHTGEGDQDEAVGSGKWDFSHLKLIKSSCPEQVNLFFKVDGSPESSYYKDTCPISAGDLTLQWTSEGVHDCESIAGPWDLISRPDRNTGTDVHNTSDIDGEVYFKLKCIGDYTDSEIIGTAKASCGPIPCEGDDCNPDNGGGGNSTNDGSSIISPKFIEA